MEYSGLEIVIWANTILFALGAGYIIWKNRDIFTYEPK